jgi:L-lysine 6-transaminase
MKSVFDITIDFEKSHGSFVYDKKLNVEYLDLFSMYSSLPLGYNHAIFDDEYKEKISNISYLRTCNNLFKSDELSDFLIAFEDHVFSSNIHFTCTGALAVESALKSAMEYKKVKNPMVLSLDDSFHGISSWGGFITDRFEPVGERLKFCPENNWRNLAFDDVEKYFAEEDLSNLVAFVLEPIRCTYGDKYVPKEQIFRIQELCRANDVCFIVDEVQTGFGVTGQMWYMDHLQITPDILIFGKKSQICGIVLSDKYSEAHDSPSKKLSVTFDGDLIDAVRGLYVMRAYEKFGLLSNANTQSDIFRSFFESKVLNYRSSGLLIAFDFESSDQRNNFISSAYHNKLLCNPTGKSSVRLRPNMAISTEEVERALDICKLSLRQVGI